MVRRNRLEVGLVVHRSTFDVGIGMRPSYQAHTQIVRPRPTWWCEALLNNPDFQRELVQVALQRFLDAEMTEHLQAVPHERNSKRQGYRNGYRPRQLRTRVGTLEVAVPVHRVVPSIPSCSSATSEASRRWR